MKRRILSPHWSRSDAQCDLCRVHQAKIQKKEKEKKTRRLLIINTVINYGPPAWWTFSFSGDLPLYILCDYYECFDLWQINWWWWWLRHFGCSPRSPTLSYIEPNFAMWVMPQSVFDYQQNQPKEFGAPRGQKSTFPYWRPVAYNSSLLPLLATCLITPNKQ